MTPKFMTDPTDIPLGRQPDFLKLWAGQSVSLLGSQVSVLALPLTAIYTLHASALQVGLLGTAQWLPFLLIALPVGAWSDRHRRRPALIAADMGRAVLLGAVVGLGVEGILTMPVLIATAFGLGMLAVIFEVCYTSYVPMLVSRSQLIAANSRLQASASAAEVGGPGVGGMLVQLLTAPVALAADATSFAVSAASLAWIRTREPEPARAGDDQDGALTRIRAGLAFTMGDRLLRAMLGTSTISNLFGQWILTLFTLFAVRQLGLSAATIGLILSCGGAGAIVGALLAAPATARLGIGGAIVWSCALDAVMLTVPFAPAGRAVAVLLLAATFLISGVGIALSTVVTVSVRQAITPDYLLGRVNATYRFVSYSVISLGALLGGITGHVFGLRAGLAIGAVGSLGTVAWVFASPLRRMRDAPAQAVAETTPVSFKPGVRQPTDE